jgi:hypothetical protein
MGLMMTHPYIDLASRRAAEDDLSGLTDFQSHAPTLPHTTLTDRQLARIGSGISLLLRAEKAERQLAQTTRTLLEVGRQKDLLAKRCAEQLRMICEHLDKRASAGLDAAAAWNAIAAKADEEGAIHADDVLAILRSMGAR